jgi:hypothetical protein
MRMQSEILHVFRSSRQSAAKTPTADGVAPAIAGTGLEFGLCVASGANPREQLQFHHAGRRGPSASRDVALTFLRLANLDNEIVDRLSRYEATLWRQLAQTLFALQALKHR